MRALVPGLLESVYRRCLMYEPGLRGLDVYAEYPIPIRYKEVVLDCGYRAELLVDECKRSKTKLLMRSIPSIEPSCLPISN